MTTKFVTTCGFLCLATVLSAQEPASFVAGKPFACADYSGQKIFLVGASGKVEWEYASGTCNELWVLPNGNLLFNTGFGVKEVTRDKQTVFAYTSQSEIYACQRLANGNTFVGECSSGRLLELTPDGRVVKELRLLPEGTDGGHVFMRNARQLANGHYLVTHYGEERVREYDPQGRCVWQAAAPGGPHTAVRLPNGHTLIATGDKRKDPRLSEVDADGKVVWELSNQDLPGAPLSEKVARFAQVFPPFLERIADAGLKLAAYAFQRYGLLEGRIAQVSRLGLVDEGIPVRFEWSGD